jgi:hypothetical protein
MSSAPFPTYRSPHAALTETSGRLTVHQSFARVQEWRTLQEGSAENPQETLSTDSLSLDEEKRRQHVSPPISGPSSQVRLPHRGMLGACPTGLAFFSSISCFSWTTLLRRRPTKSRNGPCRWPITLLPILPVPVSLLIAILSLIPNCAAHWVRFSLSWRFRRGCKALTRSRPTDFDLGHSKRGSWSARP